MSELDDLSEIAEANAFGFRGLDGHGTSRRMSSETCGAGHPWADDTTRWHRDKRNRLRRVCRVCDKLRSACRRNAARMPTA